jgi:hypothetical protein
MSDHVALVRSNVCVYIYRGFYPLMINASSTDLESKCDTTIPFVSAGEQHTNVVD